MTLRDLLGPAAPAVPVGGLAYDNRKVTPGTLFFCVPGFTVDGHDFAPDAVSRGAIALVVARRLDTVPPDVPQWPVDDVRATMAACAARFHGDPTATLETVGITGTNGKTTCAHLVRGLLEGAGRRTGMLGTVVSVVGGERAATVRTTPEAIDLQATFARMRAAGDLACVMEVSSHALELHRADAIHWAAVAFTNLTQDHLDFHPDMEAYFAAKRRLLEQAGDAPKVVNVDDRYGARLRRDFPDAIAVSLDDVRDLEPGLTGTAFTLSGTRMRVGLPGRFNVANALTAIALARALGVSDEQIADALPGAGRVPGRFEPVDEGQRYAVLVDYAHTPDGLENVLQAAQELARDARVIAVFGAGGDRDRAKRPRMGEIAARLSDVAIVTSDNPRTEDPQAIIDDVVGDDRDMRQIPDRRAAIAEALAVARTGDVVVIAGKGHEQGQDLGDRVVPFDDVAVAREVLRAHMAS